MNTPSSERLHITFFGCTNSGKSSLFNAILGQNHSVVSDVKGTTTDPVSKAMELLPLGPVLLTDTAGLDDHGELGDLRVGKTMEAVGRCDLAVLVVDGRNFDGRVSLCSEEHELLDVLMERKVPFVIALNKADLAATTAKGTDEISLPTYLPDDVVCVRTSAACTSCCGSGLGFGIDELKKALVKAAGSFAKKKTVLGGIVSRGDTVVLVCPIDEAAPKGRLILPQQMVLREVLDLNARAIVIQDGQLEETLESLKNPPDLVITDSQVFGRVAGILPEEIPLTSFSILMARYKGFLDAALDGISAIGSLEDGSKVLISEGCSHHRQCGDIGSVKIPALLRKKSGKKVEIELTSGLEFPADLEEYSLVIHCGGCMLNEREVEGRKNRAVAQKVPFINYGIFLAWANGILDRSIKPLEAYRD